MATGGELLDRVREREERAAEDDYLWLELTDELLGLVNVDVELLVVEGPGVDFQTAHPGGAEGHVAYVPAVAGVEDYGLIAGLGEPEERRLVGVGS